MARPGRANGALAAMLVAVLLGACSPAEPTPSTAFQSAIVAGPTASPPAPSPSEPAASPTPEVVAVAPAHWTDCGRGFLCADVRVPKDYAAPSNGYVNISLIDLPATDPKTRIGSLVVNPGGPGGSGVDFVRESASVFSAAMRERFDIVGFDPRGVNSSTAVRCIDNLDEQAQIDPTPDNATELRALIDSARAYADACAERNADLLPYLGTDSVARDLDAIRQAVGDKQLTYLGFSYGTLIGSVYADLFPDHIRAMVLDGAIDPALDLKGLRFGQARAFEDELTRFLKDCSSRPSCAFYEKGQTVQAFNSLMASIDARSLPAIRLNDARSVGPGIAWSAVVAALYSKSSWSVLATTLALAKQGDGSLMLAIADPYRGRNPNGSYSNEQDAYTSNTCLDFQAPTDTKVYSTWATELEATAPHFADLFAYSDLPCAFWPVPAERTPTAASAAGAPPIVVVGSTGDPATPYGWAVALSRELQSGILVTRKGDGHTGYAASSCVRRAVDAYLQALTLPKKGLTCT